MICKDQIHSVLHAASFYLPQLQVNTGSPLDAAHRRKDAVPGELLPSASIFGRPLYYKQRVVGGGRTLSRMR